MTKGGRRRAAQPLSGLSEPGPPPRPVDLQADSHQNLLTHRCAWVQTRSCAASMSLRARYDTLRHLRPRPVLIGQGWPEASKARHRLPAPREVRRAMAGSSADQAQYSTRASASRVPAEKVLTLPSTISKA